MSLVFAAAIVALLSMVQHYVPGVTLLLAVPVLLGWIVWDHGGWILALGLCAFASKYRNPLLYFWRQARGNQPEVPL